MHAPSACCTALLHDCSSWVLLQIVALINNAGIALDGCTQATFDAQMTVNYEGPKRLALKLAPHMSPGGGHPAAALPSSRATLSTQPDTYHLQAPFCRCPQAQGGRSTPAPTTGGQRTFQRTFLLASI